MALKMPRLVIVTASAINGVMLPILSREYDKGNLVKCNEYIGHVLSVLIYILFPCGCFLFFMAPEIVIVLFGESFVGGIITLRIASLLIFTLGFSNLFGTQLLLISGNERKLLFCTVIGAISNIILNLVLIPKYQNNGAAIASVISELLVTIAALYHSKRIFSFFINKKCLYSSIISCFFLCVVIFVSKVEIDNYVLKLLTAITLGGVIYFFVNWILKNPVVLIMHTVVLDYIKKNKNS